MKYSGEIEQAMRILYTSLSERDRRRYAAIEAAKLGHGGITYIASILGCSFKTICQGQSDLAVLSGGIVLKKRIPKALPASDQPQQSLHVVAGVQVGKRIRRPGSGRKPIELRHPEIEAVLERMLTDEVAGDPMCEKRWVRSSLDHLSRSLKAEGYSACGAVVARLLRRLGYSPKANERKQGQSRPNCPERDEQFRYIASQRETFSTSGWPIISVDTKKKELIGNFRNNGKSWCKKAEEVDEHDFPSAAECRAVPFGVYELIRNKGHVFVGISNDTPEFAAVSVAKWWEREGRAAYPRADRLLILADGGGSNGCRARAWKCNLQTLISDRFGLTLTVCHYPTGCSKWNPVEHRLFSFISKNWEGKPLRSLEIMLGYIRGTRTEAGLEVTAHLDEGFYKKSVSYSHKEVDQLCLKAHDVCPQWNYTISPQHALSNSYAAARSMRL
jgi:Rhodopirellula transposase DDE domain